MLDAATLAPVARESAVVPLSFPYVPGLLSFRELPVLAAVWEKLQVRPDVLIFDGHGIAHPRRIGIACHGGLLFGVPSICCAKSLLVGRHGPLGEERGATAELLYRGEVVGMAVRTRRGVQPVYVSPGHLMDLPTAVELVLRVSPRYREPETTRHAHRLVDAVRRGGGALTLPTPSDYRVAPMNLKLISLMGLVVLATGCKTEIRASSRLKLSEKDSKIALMGSEEDVVRRLSETFAKRGQVLIDRKPYQDSTVYTFKGPRVPFTTAEGQYIAPPSKRIGSIYYVLVKTQDGNTLVELLGKPTLDGKPVCSDQEVPWARGCEAILAGEGSSSRRQMTGRDEAEAIRSVLLELELGTSGAPGFAVVKEPEPGPMEPTCVAQELPEWKSASAVQKRDLLRKCAVLKPKAPAEAAGTTP